LNRSKINVLFFCATIIFSIFLASCAKDNPTAPPPLPLPPSTTGTWSGTLSQDNVSGTLLLDLSQDVVSFIGSGELGSLTLSVVGENHYPDISFTCSHTGYQPFTFVGTFTSPTDLSGFVNGSGFVQAVAVLTKN